MTQELLDKVRRLENQHKEAVLKRGWEPNIWMNEDTWNELKDDSEFWKKITGMKVLVRDNPMTAAELIEVNKRLNKQREQIEKLETICYGYRILFTIFVATAILGTLWRFFG